MFTLKKQELLSSKKTIEELFTNGKSFLVYPIKVAYLRKDMPGDFPAQAAFSVSKRYFKKAVDRNLIKRRVKEAYRLQKPEFYEQLENKRMAIMFIYVAKDILPYAEIEKAVKTSIKKLLQEH